MTWAADRWFGEDKLTHATFCFAGWLALTRVTEWPIVLLIEIAAALGVELVQAWRLRAGKTSFADHPSYRDLVWDGLGVVAGVLWLHFFPGRLT